MTRQEFFALITLTRHFFVSFFRLSFLDDAGEESFKRGIIGIVTVIAGLGLLLSRLYMGRYKTLRHPDTIIMTVHADRLLIITLPMIATAAVMALVVHSVFPDETDFRTLMPLPLSRSTIFIGKLTALFLFASLFTTGANVFLALPLSVIVNGRIANQSALLANLVQWLVGIWASGFAVAAVVAAQGLLIVALPKISFRKSAIWLQSGLIAMLVLTLPFVLRIPALGPLLRYSPGWLLALPPVWFLGAEDHVLGQDDPFTFQLALVAVVATTVVIALCVGASLTVYRRFDQSALQPGTSRAPLRWNIGLHWPAGRHPARAAVRDFMSATLRRSGLHQLVFYSVFAVGVAMAINSLLGSIALDERWLRRAVLGAPFTLMAGGIVGLRTTLRLPTNLRAAWVFRCTEQEATRAHQFDAVKHALFVSGVILPTAIALPVQAAQLGLLPALALMPITLTIGYAFTELAALNWRRIPFTCTFLFAKRSPAYTMFLIVMIFGWFVFAGTSLLDVARTGVIAWGRVMLFAGTTGLTLRMWRRQSWGSWPLEFEDYLPDGLDTLRLGE